MKNKKKILSRVLYSIGWLHSYQRIQSGKLIIFNYHRIRPDDPDFEPPFDEDVFGPSLSEFKRQMEWLKQKTNVLSESDLLNFLSCGKLPAGLNVLVTFDDGYLDNFTLAYPVLKKLDISAIFFIPTAMIQSRSLGWWDITAYLIKNTDRHTIIHYGHSFDLRTGRLEPIRYFHSILQQMRPRLIRELLLELAEYCQVPFPTLEEQGSQLMSWAQIRALADGGISIGSHTHSHPTLSTLRPDEQKEEMIRSKSILTEEIGADIQSIAYPIGGYAHISAETGRLSEEAGYRAGFTYNTGFNTFRKMNRYDLKRMCGPDDIYFLFAYVYFPNLFTWREKKRVATLR